jgi:hypothetical protein
MAGSDPPQLAPGGGPLGIIVLLPEPEEPGVPVAGVPGMFEVLGWFCLPSPICPEQPRAARSEMLPASIPNANCRRPAAMEASFVVVE